MQGETKNVCKVEKWNLRFSQCKTSDILQFFCEGHNRQIGDLSKKEKRSFRHVFWLTKQKFWQEGMKGKDFTINVDRF